MTDDRKPTPPSSSPSRRSRSPMSTHGPPGTSTDLLTSTENEGLHRGLEQRHLSMLALAGAIGTGLFLGLGGAVQMGGPVGALLGYALVGAVVCAVQFALGETAALLPVTGSFVRHADFLVDPAWGFALGWNLVYGAALSVPSEITAICVLVSYWRPDASPALSIVPAIALTVAVGFARVRAFGEVEFSLALLKLALVVFLIVLGFVIDVGGVPGTPAVGFARWRDPGPFVDYLVPGALGRFLGFWAVTTGAVFSFAGVESLAMAAAETSNPRTAIPQACKRVFVRIVLFYLLSVLVVGLLVASNDPRLDGSGNSVAQSPFVMAASEAGIPAVASLVNAVVITSAWSSSNQSLLAGTRVLYGLALKGQAPRVFLRTTSWGVPYACVLLFTAVMFLSFLGLSESALDVFWWLVRLTAAGVIVSWSTILLNHIRLRTAMKVQHIAVSRLPWSNSWTVYSSAVALFFCILILLTSGFSVFIDGYWDTPTFVSSYLNIPLVLIAYLAWKYTKKTKLVSLYDIPLQEAFRQSEESLEEVGYAADQKTSRLLRAISWIWD